MSPAPALGSPKPRTKRARSLRGAPNDVQTALASLAHEVRTPLNGILAMSELLSASELPARERGWAAALKSAAEHLAKLMNLVLESEQAGAGTLQLRREEFELHPIITGLAQSLHARAALKGLSAEVQIPSALPERVIGDAVRLRAMVENLIDNATKFTDSGRVELAVTSDVQNGLAALTFSVSDQGVGLSNVELRRIFRPFTQANTEVSAKFGGSGLGLAFTKAVAKAMGGDVEVSSAPGRGSTFRLSVVLELPSRAQQLRSAPAETREPRQCRQDAPLRILCAEDNPYGRVIVNTLAGSLGHEIHFVASGEAAVSAVREGRYDLVLMDLTLPDLDGIEAARRIRALPGAARDLPIIGIAGDASECTAALAAGMNLSLLKPLAPRALADAIKLGTASPAPSSDQL